MEDETYTDVTFTITMDLEESDSLNIYVSLEVISFETDERKRIGYANMYIFNEYRVNSWVELIDNADAISGDVLEVIDVLDKAKDNEEKAINYYIQKGFKPISRRIDGDLVMGKSLL